MTQSLSMTSVAALGDVRRRRAELGESLAALRQVVVAVDRLAPTEWSERLHAAGGALAADFADHVRAAEGPGGLHLTVLAAEPRLTHAVDSLTAEHLVLAAELAAVVTASAAPVAGADVDALAQRAAVLIAQLVRHRQRGADLVHEAISVDLGGGD